MEMRMTYESISEVLVKGYKSDATAKQIKTIKIFGFALVRPGPYYQIVLYIC